MRRSAVGCWDPRHGGPSENAYCTASEASLLLGESVCRRRCAAGRCPRVGAGHGYVRRPGRGDLRRVQGQDRQRRLRRHRQRRFGHRRRLTAMTGLAGAVRRIRTRRAVRRGRVPAPARDDSGAAVPEFLMVSIVLIFLTVLILQAILYLYVRNIVAASAAEGTRYAANANVDPQRGAARATELLIRGTSRSVADQLQCEGREEAGENGATVNRVHCSGTVSALFLPGFGVLPIDVRNYAVEEQA